MKPSILLLTLLVLSVSACGRTVVKEKETIREQPVITQEREVVIERPATALRSCTYSATTYSHGSTSCQGGYQYRCNDGVWDGRNLSC